MRNRTERLYAVGLGVLAVGYTVMATSYDFGPLSRPGPGFLPVIIGVGLTVCAVVLFFIGGRPQQPTNPEGEALEGPNEMVRVTTSGHSAGEDEVSAAGTEIGPGTVDAEGTNRMSGEPPEGPTSLRRPLLVLAISAGFVVGLPYIGFIVGTLLMTTLAAKVLGVGWWRAAALGAGMAILAYLVFDRWLLVPFPTGLIPLG
ncbi:MAG: tripartite tricarboxylate transporter TctB family protein [Homoserinimonas sp.]